MHQYVTCPICFDNYHALTRMCRTSTQHEACGWCVQQLKTQHKSCAICRGPLHDHVYPTLTQEAFLELVQSVISGWTQQQWDAFQAQTPEVRAQLWNNLLQRLRAQNPHHTITIEVGDVRINGV